MNASQQERLNQRLDQHSDATEIILKRLDEIIANAHIRSRRLYQIEARLNKIERIVLPYADKP